MRRHDERDARLDGRPERYELDGPQPVRRMLDDGKLDVGVGRGIAVSGKMLAARRHAGSLQLLDDHAAQPGNRFRFRAEGAIADDGVLRVCVNIEHRRVVERDPHGRQFGGQRTSELPGERGIVAPPQHRHRRPLGERRPQPRHAAAFLIDADPAWLFSAEGPQVERQLCDLLGRFDVVQAPEEGNAPEIELASQRAQLDGDEGAREAADEQLSDAAAKRLRRHDLSL